VNGWEESRGFAATDRSFEGGSADLCGEKRNRGKEKKEKNGTRLSEKAKGYWPNKGTKRGGRQTIGGRRSVHLDESA